MQLAKKIIDKIDVNKVSVPSGDYLSYPEKVLQFGTGVLLRGLPDYFIDKANKQGKFCGRVVVIKSTATGGTDAFEKQDGLYTLCVRSLENGKKVEEDIVIGAVSRVLSAREEWDKIISCAADPQIELIISNTTEVGIVLDVEDNIIATPPQSFPGKLLAILYERYKKFNGDPEKGMVIIPTELITNNGDKLKAIVIALADLNNLEVDFTDWLNKYNHFCNSLVDRIVPGKLPSDKQAETCERLGYMDELMIMSEVYRLWAIETSDEKVKNVLSFATADNGVVLTKNIEAYRELKLRLLNGSHSFTCGLAVMAGFKTVLEAMEDDAFNAFITKLAKEEIADSIQSDDIKPEDILNFASVVLDRFRNPFIEHRWLSITMQYSSKMQMRNVPLIIEYIKRHYIAPRLMALGFAAYILFMRSEQQADETFKGELNGEKYTINDDKAAILHEHWKNGEANVVKSVLSDEELWACNLSSLNGFQEKVETYLHQLINEGAATVLEKLINPVKVSIE
ncbi:MAG: tagaturonate reductase [Sphingobacteriales bacterium]|nr:tagaturonate reductase [Sphingobacteriales bacterium]